ncbi:MAG: type II and III secretion system protein family protein [Planctomycetota bacterium]
MGAIDKNDACRANSFTSGVKHRRTSWTGKWLFIASVLFILALAFTSNTLAAEQGSEQSDQQVALTAEGEQQVLHLSLSHSMNVEPPWAVKRVSIANPDIADVKVLSPHQVLVMGKQVGSTDLIMWSENEKVLRTKVDVGIDLAEIKMKIKELFPNASIEITRSQDTILVKGDLGKVETAAKLHEYLGSTGIKYVDMTRLAGPQQVLLRVRVAEVSRTALRTMAVNLFHTSRNFFGGAQIGSSGGPFNPVSIGPASGTPVTGSVPFEFTEDVTVSSGATLFMGFPRAQLEFFVRALAENQYLRLLAEPNLVTKSGEEATFLAGGEFPVPVVQSVGGGGDTSISIEWKEFGVRLNFRPVVLGEGTIRLRVMPEVSTLSDVGSVTIEGFTVPSLIVRRANATLELHSGETFGMAGLLSENTTATSSRIPGLGDLPVLGTLFRSTRYRKEETELVVLVTASLVQPLAQGLDRPLPGVLHSPPTDWQFFIKGQIEGSAPPKLCPNDAQHLENLGIDKIVGPGGWELYEASNARSYATERVEKKVIEPEEQPESSQ